VFVALDKALYAKLAGTPYNALGLPTDPVSNPGVRLPVYQGSINDINKPSFDPYHPLPGQFRQVPVYRKSGAGVDWRAQYPAVVYDFVSAQPRDNLWLPPVGQNKLSVPNNSPVVEYRNRHGQLVASGPTVITEVPLPTAIDVLVQIELQSKIQYEALLLLRAVLNLLPMRGALVVPFANGTRHVCDMILIDDIALGEDEDVALNNAGNTGAYREHRYILTYVVEAYLDTTFGASVTSTPTVREAITEMAFSGQPDADNVESQSGVVEVIDVIAK